jgi:CubicO group peptidase (beta-lactamase class C family)
VASIGGKVDAAFGDVRDAFAANFDDGEMGASCAISVNGRVVVDVWGGFADATGRRLWASDTLVNAYSVGKPIVALMLLQGVEDGGVDLDVPATAVWPALVAGQRGATVRQALCHQAGIPAIREPVENDALGNWGQMASALGRTEPWWEPGTRHTYHTNTYGHLVGELARRVDGRLPGDWLREEIGDPLDADLFWGVPLAAQARCADVLWDGGVPPDRATILASELSDEQKMVFLGYVNPPGYASVGVVNTAAWRSAQVPSTNLHATARGVARLYGALAAGGEFDGVHVLDGDLLAEATRTQSEGWCPVLERDVSFGLGFQPTRADRPFGPNPRSFGHFGTGGALGFADPDAAVGFGYVMNAVKPRWQNPRNRRLIDALYACL